VIPVLRTAVAIRRRELRVDARTIAADDTELPSCRFDLAFADFRVPRERLRIEAVKESAPAIAADRVGDSEGSKKYSGDC